MKLSGQARAIKLAYEKGYRVLGNGEVLGSSGKIVKGNIDNHNGLPYRRFNIKWPGRKTRFVYHHRLLAYQLFGEQSFTPGIVTRHLDGNSLNNTPDNIRLGSLRDNSRDIDPLKRQRLARNAGRQNNPYTEEFWQKVTLDHQCGLSYKELGIKYGLKKGTLSYRLSKTAKHRVVDIPE